MKDIVISDRIKIFLECDKLPKDFFDYSLNLRETFILSLSPFGKSQLFLQQTVRHLELKLHLQDST